jgi:hypothetical protein
MKFLGTAPLALGCALLVAGCGGGGGPASPTFDPFGSESSGAASESSGASTEGLGGKEAVADLCATDCARIQSGCPSAAGSNCVASCQAELAAYPACTVQAQQYLECIATIAIVCSPGGSFDASACRGSLNVWDSCAHPTTNVTGTPAP